MNVFTSTIGLKAQMALSGIALIGFVLIHMLGNLQIFLGAEALNSYAELLKSNAAVLWGARLVLLGSVGVHLFSAYTLTMRSRAARVTQYAQKTWLSSDYAVRTMRWGGVIVLLFIVYHLLHLTVGAPVAASSSASLELVEGRVDVYSNVVRGFQNPVVSIFYIVAQVMLGLHLAHGVWSLARTLGIRKASWIEAAQKAAIAIGVLITVGNCSIPLAVLFGLVKLG
jgi:succinate dehydrogenase / fumarate reductase, cytochrome b subunit